MLFLYLQRLCRTRLKTKYKFKYLRQKFHLNRVREITCSTVELPWQTHHDVLLAILSSDHSGEVSTLIVITIQSSTHQRSAPLKYSSSPKLNCGLARAVTVTGGQIAYRIVSSYRVLATYCIAAAVLARGGADNVNSSPIVDRQPIRPYGTICRPPGPRPALVSQLIMSSQLITIVATADYWLATLIIALRHAPAYAPRIISEVARSFRWWFMDILSYTNVMGCVVFRGFTY